MVSCLVRLNEFIRQQSCGLGGGFLSNARKVLSRRGDLTLDFNLKFS
ncbi:hypothetical protein CSC34_4967 [Pseudomonas aeruginosa]|nr:hypothetical protein CSC34_4967 [Pseudomonas aeruginosa]